MAARTASSEDKLKDPLSVTASGLSRANGSFEKSSLDGSTLREHYHQAASSMLQSVSEPYQLFTPEPTPSPLTSSSSLALTEPSYIEWNADMFSQDRPKRSASFDHNARGKDDDMSPEIISSPKPISKMLPPHELHDIPEEKSTKPRRLPTPDFHPPTEQLHSIPEEKSKRPRKLSVPEAISPPDDKVLKLSPLQIEELTSTPKSLPISLSTRLQSPNSEFHGQPTTSNDFSERFKSGRVAVGVQGISMSTASSRSNRPGVLTSRAISSPITNRLEPSWTPLGPRQQSPSCGTSPMLSSTPPFDGQVHRVGSRPEPVIEINRASKTSANGSAGAPKSEPLPSPIPQDIPLPPMSIPTYLQLELASSRPSPLYIHRSAASEYPYESSKVKFERLLNFLLLPPQLEQVLGFGALACLDAWLHTFTILPLRFLKAISILVQWWGTLLSREVQFLTGFVYHGAGRMWLRQRDTRRSVDSTSASRSASQSRAGPSPTQPFQSKPPGEIGMANGTADPARIETERKAKSTWGKKHKRTKSQPSNLSSFHKADMLQGSVIMCSCMILMCFDASRMYHSIRGQSAIKLYMIWNVLEVGDRLLAALGQDIFECLFSDETIERGPDGRSKLLRPFGMFILALIYNVIHAVVLFYQVITLNVAVNSYSNALLTLLMSNMFVEIKSTVFKKFEKDNIFQLTCADIVERFQLWLMLVIIGLRNIVEVGGLSVGGTVQAAANNVHNGTVPLRSNSILPSSFTILPNWTGEVLSPFLLVLGSEMIVDWLKHAYISKFNNVKPALYQKFLDVLAKDYYTNAFVNQNLTKRLGLPVIPLSCLFIRASVQTYHMFLATHLPTPIPSTATELALETEATASPVTTAALEHFDAIIRRALGRSTFGGGLNATAQPWYMIGTDDVIAFLTMLIFFLCTFLVLLACKLVLGMVLLSYSRNRYRTMKEREHLILDTKGKRLGGWGMVEVDDDKRRWFYEDDAEGAKVLKDREKKAAAKAREAEKGSDFTRVTRYEMSAKRIW